MVAAVYAQPLNEYLSNFQSLKANFTQVASSALGGGSNATGQVWIEKPGKFRWAVNKPHAQLFISDGKKLWRYEPALLQATVQPLTSQLSQTPLMLLSGQVKNINKLFTVKSYPDAVFKLFPKTANSLIKSIRLSFKNGKLYQFDLTSSAYQTTEVTFSNVVLNSGISASQFTFTPPKGVDVLKG